MVKRAGVYCDGCDACAIPCLCQCLVQKGAAQPLANGIWHKAKIRQIADRRVGEIKHEKPLRHAATFGDPQLDQGAFEKGAQFSLGAIMLIYPFVIASHRVIERKKIPKGRIQSALKRDILEQRGLGVRPRCHTQKSDAIENLGSCLNQAHPVSTFS